jgi:tRNA A-37 threonylcarbamoyl transferase component Bud32
MEPGRRMGDRYELTRHIAAGGMGDVWEANDTVLERLVAVKVLRAEHAIDPEFVERFRNEAKHAAALSDPRITAVYDYGETEDNGSTLAYLVMELVPGEPLSAILAREGSLPVGRTMGLIADTADALQAAHDAGVIHRDVKPGNILVRPDGSVSITDFGIARATTESNHLTKSGLVLGTAFYLPPEQASGKPVTPASDLYSLGVVAYQCLSGTTPFVGDNPVHVAVAHLRDEPPPLPDIVPAAVRQFVMKLLDKDPLRRPARAADVATAARSLQQHPDDAEGLAATALLPVAAAATAPVPLAMDEISDVREAEPVKKRVRWQSDAYPGQRRTRSLLLLVGLAVVVLGALLLVLVTGGRKDHPTAAAVTPSASPTPRPTQPPLVTVTAASYIGKKYATVQQQLAALGLTVQRATAVSDRPADTVIGITPSGRLPAHSTVKVTVAVPKPHEKKHGHGKGPND